MKKPYRSVAFPVAGYFKIVARQDYSFLPTSVYAQFPDGRLKKFRDFKSFEDAEEYADDLAFEYRHSVNKFF